MLGWLTRITLIFALLGLLGFEVLSVAVTHVQIQDIGQSAGQDAISRLPAVPQFVLAFEAASAYAESQERPHRQEELRYQ